MQLRYLGSCRCNSWAAHTHWCITSATLPAPCKVRKCRRGSEVHHHDFAVCDANHWASWYCTHKRTKQERDLSLLSKPSMGLMLIHWSLSCTVLLVPFMYCPTTGTVHDSNHGQRGIIWENSSWHRSKPDEGQSCGMHNGCRPFSSHRPG